MHNGHHALLGFFNLTKGVNSKVVRRPLLGVFANIGNWFAANVAARLLPAPTLTPTLVPVTVRHAVGDGYTLRAFEKLAVGEKVPVYNLKVADEAEFVCQGVLVHNCDSTMMSLWGANSPTSNGFEVLNENPFYKS